MIVIEVLLKATVGVSIAIALAWLIAKYDTSDRYYYDLF